MSKKSIASITEKLKIPEPNLCIAELMSEILKIIKDDKKIQNYVGCIETNVEIKSWMPSFLAMLLKENIYPEIVNLLLQHSIQNGFTLSEIDLNIKTISMRDDENLLDCAIIGCNYEHFRKLIELNVDYLNCLGSISIWAGTINGKREYSEQERENRRKMLKDLLSLGIKVNEDFINSVTMDSEVDFFEIAAESESGKKLLTPSFLEKLMESCKHRQRNKKDNSMLTAIVKLYKSKQIEKILEQEKNKDAIKAATSIVREEVKKQVKDIIASPEFIAEIVETVNNMYGHELGRKVADGLRKKMLENPQEFMDRLIPKP